MQASIDLHPAFAAFALGLTLWFAWLRLNPEPDE